MITRVLIGAALGYVAGAAFVALRDPPITGMSDSSTWVKAPFPEAFRANLLNYVGGTQQIGAAAGAIIAYYYAR